MTRTSRTSPLLICKGERFRQRRRFYEDPGFRPGDGRLLHGAREIGVGVAGADLRLAAFGRTTLTALDPFALRISLRIHPQGCGATGTAVGLMRFFAERMN